MSKMHFRGPTLGAAFTASVAVGAVTINLSNSRWGNDHADTGTITRTVYERSKEMVAPEGVIFEFVADGLGVDAPATDMDYDPRKTIIEYFVNFDVGGTDEAWKYVDRVPLSQRSRNLAYAHNPAYVFREAREYTIEVFAVGPTGLTASATYTHTPLDPDTFYTGDRTIILDPSGNFKDPNIPPDSQQSTTIADALSKLNALSEPGRIQVVDGETVDFPTSNYIGKNYPNFNFGPLSGRFLIDTSLMGTTGLLQFAQQVGLDDGSKGDVRVFGFDATGPWDPVNSLPQTTETPVGLMQISSPVHFTLDDIKATGFQTVIGGDSVAGIGDGKAVVIANDIDGSDFQNFGFYTASNPNSYYAYLGCRMEHNPQGYMGSQERQEGGEIDQWHGPQRLQWVTSAYLAGCQYFSNATWTQNTHPPSPQPCLRLVQDPFDDRIGSITVERCVFEGGGGQVVTCGNLNTDNNPAIHLTYQYNYVLLADVTNQGLQASTSMVARGNIVVVPDSPQTFGLNGLITTKDTGANSIRATFPSYIYSNTLIHDRSGDNWNSNFDYVFEDNENGATPTNYISNNVTQSPQGSPADNSDAPLSRTRHSVPLYAGHRYKAWSFNGTEFPAVDPIDTRFGTPSGTTTDSTVALFVPEAGSKAIADAIDEFESNQLVSQRDYLMQVRAGKFDPDAGTVAIGIATRGANEAF